MGKKLLKITAIMAGVLVGLVLLLTLLLNSSFFECKVRDIAGEYIEGSLDFERLSFSLLRQFPSVALDINELSLVPSDAPDSLIKRANLSLGLNPWPLLSGKIKITEFRIYDSELALRFYSNGKSNLNIIKSPESDTTDSSSLSLPRIELSRFIIENSKIAFDNEVLYTEAHVKYLGACAIMSGDSSFVGSQASIDTLSASIAGIPLRGEGKCELMEAGALSLEAQLFSKDCPLGNVIARYGALFSNIALDFRTDARADISLTSKGVLSADSYPHTSIALSVPTSGFAYYPLDLQGTLGLNANAVLSENANLSINLKSFALNAAGAELSLKGKAYDMLAESRRLDFEAKGKAILDTLVPVLFDSSSYSACGVLDFDLSADASLKSLLSYDFEHSNIKTQVSSPYIQINIASDSLDASVFGTSLRLESAESALSLEVNLDSLSCHSGSNMALRVKKMQNRGNLMMVESRGKMTPKLELHSQGARVFARSGRNMLGIINLDLLASLQKRVRSDRFRSLPDSVRRQRLDSLRKGAYRAEGDFAHRDIKVDLDSSLRAYWRQWKPYGQLAMDKAFVASPSLPLRTRVYAFNGTFDDNELNIDSLNISCGSSNLISEGKVSGIRRFVNGRGVLDLDLNLKSNRLNVNEILSAIELAEPESASLGGDEFDESFVIDSLSNAVYDPTSELMVVPGNVKAHLQLDVDSINYTDFTIKGLKSTLSLQDRTLQLLNTELSTGFANIGIDAYYATRSMDDISVGLDLRLSELSAYDLIHLMPSVESFMPAIKSFEGKLSCDISATAKLDSAMNVIIPSVSGLLRLGGNELYVKDAGNLRKITTLLLFKNKNIGKIDDLSMNAVIHDGKLELFPFELGVDRYKFAMHGMHSYDGKMNYHISLLKSPLLILFGINIYGTTDNWKFSLGRPRYKGGNVPAYTAQMDSVQINIGRSIKNIFRMGVEDAKLYNERNIKALHGYTPDSVNEDIMLTAQVYEQIDSIEIERTLQQWSDEVDAELEAVLSTLQPSDLIKEFESLTYQKDIDRKMKRLLRRRRKEGRD